MSGLGRRLDNDRWKAVSPYLDRAMDMEQGERSAWLATLREQHPAVAADLEQLLDERDTILEEGFLEEECPRPGTPIAGGMEVGAYRLVSPLGQGGMGTVWLAERADGRFEGRVAVKLLNLSLLGARASRAEERFKREGSLLARLTHPNIARLIDAGVSPDGQPYLVLEYIDGVPIDRYCDARALDIAARLRLFLDVLAAVAHAHANLVVHRDVKPSNVLVSADGADGHVKLLDFGIAKLLQSDELPALTREGGAALTPEFAAPEQVTGHQVTTATDVYALGVLLYLLLSGRHPVDIGSMSPADLVKAIVDTDPPRPSDVVTRHLSRTPSVDDTTATDSAGEMMEPLPAIASRRGTTPERLSRLLRGDLDTIVAKALRKSPQDRYPSVTALADDLRRYLAQQPISARPDTVAYRTAKFARRHLGAVMIGCGVLAIIALLIGFYTVRLTAERDRARIEAQKAAKISELMTELLTGADPFRDKPDPTLRELLDAGAARLRQELAGEPEILSEMLTSIGRVYQRLEVSDKAQAMLEQALALGRSVPGGEHTRVADTMNDLGVLLRMKGDAKASVSMLDDALSMRRRLLGPVHKDVAVTISELGRSYGSLGQPARAETLAREALAMRREIFGERHRETATTMGDLGLLLWQRGDFAGAEPLLRQSLEISRATLGGRHANVGSALANLALVVADLGNHAEAETLLREAVVVRTTALGPRHPSLAITWNNLAYPLREQRKYPEAIAAMDEALALAIPARGDDSPTVATYRINLARVHVARGDGAAAEPLLRRALAVRRQAYGDDDWRVGTARSLLGAALTSQRQYADAERLLLDAQRVLKDEPGAQGREAKANRVRLQALYEAWTPPRGPSLVGRVTPVRFY